jgi:hypothetical protein
LPVIPQGINGESQQNRRNDDQPFRRKAGPQLVLGQLEVLLALTDQMLAMKEHYLMRDRIRVRHFSCQTEMIYLAWVRRFVCFHGGRHPREMGGPEVTQFLSYLAVERKVSASTQNQALSAILFLYKEVLEVELPWLDGVVGHVPAAPRVSGNALSLSPRTTARHPERP